MPDKIHTAKSLYHGAPVDALAGPVARRIGLTIGNPATPADVTVEAEVNAANTPRGWIGRWIVRCPCGGAEDVSPETPVFMCCSCLNLAHGHQWLRVSFPRDRVEIEEVLVKREPKNRNWKPGETIRELRAENAAHGVKE